MSAFKRNLGSVICASCLVSLAIFAVINANTITSVANAAGGGFGSGETVAAAGASDVFFDEGDSDFEVPKAASEVDAMKAEVESSGADMKRVPAASEPAKSVKKQVVKEEPAAPTEPPKELEKPARAKQAGPVGDPLADEEKKSDFGKYPDSEKPVVKAASEAKAKMESAKAAAKAVVLPEVKEEKADKAVSGRKPSSMDSYAGGGNKQISKYGWQVANRDCVMRGEASAESNEVLVVKQQRKIWVEVVDQDWFKGFRKDGSPGYLSRSCF